MSRNDVLGVGSAASLILFSGAWLSGYWNNRLPGWLALFFCISLAGLVGWYSKTKEESFSEIAKNTAIFAVLTYTGAIIIGIIATRWTHGSWSPETTAQFGNAFEQLFTRFPGGFMRSILLPTISSLIIGSLLMAIWSVLGLSLAYSSDDTDSSATKSKKS